MAGVDLQHKTCEPGAGRSSRPVHLSGGWRAGTGDSSLVRRPDGSLAGDGAAFRLPRVELDVAARISAAARGGAAPRPPQAGAAHVETGGAGGRNQPAAEPL